MRDSGRPNAIASGEIDFTANFAPPFIIPIDAGEKITIMGGVHVGCFELFGNEGIRSIADLKGKTVGVPDLGLMPARVREPPWLLMSGSTRSRISTGSRVPPSRPMELFADGKIDALLGFPPEPQELRARKIGHVIVNSSVDRPWSQYFCCMLAATGTSSARTRSRPSACCARSSRRPISASASRAGAAQRIVDRGFTTEYDYALQTLNEVPYNKWRDYDPEDTIRFYSLRLREAGMIKSNPNKIIAEGTDWRFFNELKRELKG